MTDVLGPALGLTCGCTEQEIKKRAFDAILSVGYMSFATIAADGVTPTIRGLEVHRLDESGDLFIGLCPGKPVYGELKRNPRVSASVIVSTVGRLTYSIRLNAVAVEERDEALLKRYWELNHGTEKLYRRALYNFTVFRLTRCEGEILDVYEDDKLLRFRFGGEETRPWAYEVNPRCVGCGACAQACMMQVIRIENSRAVIAHNECLECGVCAAVCPANAITKACGVI